MRPVPPDGPRGVRRGVTHSPKLGRPLWLPPASALLQYFLPSSSWGRGLLEVGGLRGEKVQLERVSNFEGPVHQGGLVEKGPFHKGRWVFSGWMEVGAVVPSPAQRTWPGPVLTLLLRAPSWDTGSDRLEASLSGDHHEGQVPTSGMPGVRRTGVAPPPCPPQAHAHISGLGRRLFLGLMLAS